MISELPSLKESSFPLEKGGIEEIKLCGFYSKKGLLASRGGGGGLSLGRRGEGFRGDAIRRGWLGGRGRGGVKGMRKGRGTREEGS